MRSEAEVNGASCVVVRGFGQSGFLVLGLYFENVKFTRAPRHGLWLQDQILTLAQGCLFDGNFGSGVFAETPAPPPEPSGATTTQFIDCTFSNNADRGCLARGVTELTPLMAMDK